MKKKVKLCKKCKEEINPKAKKCPHCGSKQGNGLLIPIIIVIVLFAIVGGGGNTDTEENQFGANDKVEVTVVDFSEMSKDEAKSWCEEKKINCVFEQEYSDDVNDSKLISQSVEAEDIINEGQKIKLVYSLGEEPSTEFKNALSKAETYSEMMHMSKDGIYNQLVSEYGEQFPKEAAQYAIDHLEADWNYNALKSAENYSDSLHMSKQGIYDQLISEYGDKFTKDQAKYAIDNIEADWNENALKSAKNYQETLKMSKDAIYDQLISEYGEKFTKDQAKYAIEHLDD